MFRNISYGGESAELPRLPSRGWWWRSHCWRTVYQPHPSSLGQFRPLTSRRENLNRKMVFKCHNNVPPCTHPVRSCSWCLGVVCSVWPGAGNWGTVTRLTPDVSSGPLSSSLHSLTLSLSTRMKVCDIDEAWRKRRGNKPKLVIDWMM